jgi:hypothetical protein
VEQIPPTASALAEALELSGIILKDIELSQLPLASVVFKIQRLARLLNLFEYQKMMEYEAGGYPLGAVLAPEQWAFAAKSNRIYPQADPKTGMVSQYAYTESVGTIEETITTGRLGLQASSDPDVAVSSANPNQFLQVPHGNLYERNQLHARIATATARLAERRAFLYQLVLGLHYELRFSGIASDVFSRIRTRVDSALASTLTDAVQRLASVHDALRSENPEDWSNAVHSCRRLLEALADAVFPPTDQDRVVAGGSGGRTIKLGPSNYINRIMCFVQDHAISPRFEHLVGSHLRYLGDRLDAIADANNKGTHATITDPAEADRFVIYTYLLLGDVLALKEDIAKAG